MKEVFKRKMAKLQNLPKEDLIKVIEDESRHSKGMAILCVLDIALIIGIYVVATNLRSMQLADLRITVLYVSLLASYIVYDRTIQLQIPIRQC